MKKNIMVAIITLAIIFTAGAILYVMGLTALMLLNMK